MTLVTALLATGSGSLVGLLLGLLGGGGSILAVPLLLYVVGVPNPHVAIGTSALVVSLNAFANLIQHARAGTVKWPCAFAFSLAGVTGAALGARLGKAVDGQLLLLGFSVLMVAVALAMVRARQAVPAVDVHLNPRNAPRIVAAGLAVGLLSGFFGIGGGFLVVPGLMAASGMAMLNAVGSSLLSVGLFGATTATSYALAGLVDWAIALPFMAGGVLGGLVGLRLAKRLAEKRGVLTRLFAGLLLVVAAYVAWQALGALGLF
jgi:uncharacterized membrane protein YfcA